MTHTAPATPTCGYFLTFHPYGTWLPGDRRGWHRRQNTFARLPPSPGLADFCRERLRYPVVTLTQVQRDIVRAAITEACAFRRWSLHALVVERTHVHAVLSAPVPPEAILRTLKSRSTRWLRERGHFVDHPHPWAEHGSTRYLFEPMEAAQKVHYVLDDHHEDARRR